MKKTFTLGAAILSVALSACGYKNQEYNNAAYNEATTYNEGATYNESENYAAGNEGANYSENAATANTAGNYATNMANNVTNNSY